MAPPRNEMIQPNPNRKMQAQGPKSDDYHRPRSQHQGRNQPVLAQLVDLQLQGVKEQYQGKGQGSHYFQGLVIDLHLEDTNALLSQQEPQSKENERKGKRRPLHQSRGEGRHREDVGDDAENQEEVRPGFQPLLAAAGIGAIHDQ